MAITSVLKLSMTITAQELGQQAREEASMFDGGDTVPQESRDILTTLNNGLRSFLTGEFAAVQPEAGDGEEAAVKWVEFANDIASAYGRLDASGHSVFYWASNLPSVLKAEAEAMGMQNTMPAAVWTAIDWSQVSATQRSKFQDMQLDGATFVTDIFLAD